MDLTRLEQKNLPNNAHKKKIVREQVFTYCNGAGQNDKYIYNLN